MKLLHEINLLTTKPSSTTLASLLLLSAICLLNFNTSTYYLYNIIFTTKELVLSKQGLCSIHFYII